MAVDESLNSGVETLPADRPRWRRMLFPELKTAGWKTRGWWLASRLAFWYAVIVVIVALLQRKLIYHPTRTDRLPAADVIPRGSVHDLELTTHDHLTLHGWHFLPQGVIRHSRNECDTHLATARWVVLFFHGNAGTRNNRHRICRVFTDSGADVFHFDYRGYAENPGKPSEADLIADARTAWDYATKVRDVPASRIIIAGESLGGGVAVQLAATVCEAGDSPAGLFLWATFSSVLDVGRHHYPWLPVGWVLRDRYESVVHAPQITCPVVQIHGDADQIVPIELGMQLHEVFPAHSRSGVKKRWRELPGVSHNDGPYEQMKDEFRALLRAILE